MIREGQKTNMNTLTPPETKQHRRNGSFPQHVIQRPRVHHKTEWIVVWGLDRALRASNLESRVRKLENGDWRLEFLLQEVLDSVGLSVDPEKTREESR